MKKRLNTKTINLSQEATDWYDLLTDEQKLKLAQGLDDIKHGRTIKSKDVWQKFGRKNP